jgi:hypothetical protein
MDSRDSWDTFESGLAGLRTYDADPERVERIRVRSVAILAARQPKARSPRPHQSARWGWVEPIVAVGLGAVYVLAVTIACASLGLLRALP